MFRYITSLLVPVLLFSYTFGKNKYETHQYNWKVSETPHFKVYYYDGEKFLSTFALSILEETYGEYTDLFGFKPQEKIPVIIYASYKDFQETNVIPGIIEEGVGGFTEILKNRVVVPFSGSYRDFRHVLRHELVHVFQYMMIKNNYKNFLYTSILNTIPLWVMEGMAEYFSLGWDTESESYIRDITIQDKLLPIKELNYYGGYIVYKEGQLIYRFIAEKYGKKACTEFFGTLIYTGNFRKAIEKTFGMELEEFNKSFLRYVRTRYYPILTHKNLPASEGKVIVDHEKWKNYLNSYPLFSKNGSKIFIVSDKTGRTDVYIISQLGGITKRVIKGEITPDFESIHVLRPGYDISQNDSLFVIATQTGKGDALIIIDLKRNKIISKKHFGLDAIYTPVFSPSSQYISFAGVKNGQEDIYIYDRKNRSVFKLTDDYYDDRDPRFLNDSTLVFVSDRNSLEGFHYGKYALFTATINTRNISRLTPYRDVMKQPFYNKYNNSIFFLADDSGSINVFALNINTRTIKRITNVTSEVINYSLYRNKIVCAVLNSGGYDIVLGSLNAQETEFNETGEFLAFHPMDYITRMKFEPSLSLDYIHGYMTYMSGFGFQGMLYLGLSDELGDRRLDIMTDLSGDITNSNFLVTFTYLPERIDHVISVYQFTDAFYDYYNNFYFAKQTGGSWDLYYPLNRFFRVEGGLAFERYKSEIWLARYDYFVKEEEIGYNLMPRIGLVYDNVLYTYLGDPWKGLRFYQGFAKSARITPKFYDLGLIFSDNRYYLGINKKSIFALRGMAGKSMGKDKYVFYLGGPETLRGYPYENFSGTSMFLFNSELRVPFVEYLKLGFPVPIAIQDIRGVLFLDAGDTWSGKKPRFFKNVYTLDDLKADIGFGLRFNIGIGYLKLDWAWKTDISHIYPKSTFNISIGNYY